MLDVIRKLFGYTQEDLAAKIGIDQRYYTQLETGVAQPPKLIKRLSEVLKMRESFIKSEGQYFEYPFLSDFYVFCLTERRLTQTYKLIVEYICSGSAFIDVVFFRVSTSRSEAPKLLGSHVMYIALRDDRGTIFLIKRRLRTRGFSLAGKRPRSDQEVELRLFPLVDSFREMLHAMPKTYVHETMRLLPDELINDIEEDAITKDDISQFFPVDSYFLGQYEAHRNLKPR